MANVLFRKRVILAAASDPEVRLALWICCKRDVLFFFNVFLWTYDPRRKGNKWLPFITYDYQDEAIAEIVKAIEEQEDLGIEKSRDMGATVMVLGVLVWFFLFFYDMSFLLGSSKQELVDKSGNHKALFQKLDSVIKRLPLFIRRSVDLNDQSIRTKNHLGNPDNGSAIDGEATVEDFGRGDRRTAIFGDEFAMWRDGWEAMAAMSDVTGCRIFGSSHKSAQTAFFKFVRELALRKLYIHWSRHPVKAAGLYTTDKDGTLKILDANYKFPKDYPFILDGKLRSPWYDRECKRRTPQEVKREIDIDPQGAAGQFFDAGKLNELIGQARLPSHVGELDWRANTLEPTVWREKDGGRFKLWFRLAGSELTLPNAHRYLVSGDISLGTGASNSVLAVWDRVTFERVGEFVSNRVPPEQLADIAIAMCYWFAGPDEGALLTWESNGPGKVFTNRVRSQGYRNLWYQPQNIEGIAPKTTDRPGIHVNEHMKLAILSEYARAIYAGDATNPSVDALRECHEIIDTPNGPRHSKEIMRTMDVTGEGKFHADRVTADAIAWWILKDFAILRPDDCEELPEEEPLRPSPLTFAGRRQIWKRGQVVADRFEW